MSLTHQVYGKVQDLVEYVAWRLGIPETVRKLQLAQQFATSEEELQLSQLPWIPARLQGWLVQKAIEVFGERTWKYQDTLPPLPVPPLRNTLHKYLESVKPFVTTEEYKITQEAVREFETGVGQTLHQRLLERARTHRNWLEDWWLDLAYLQSRSPLPLSSNYAGTISTLEPLKQPDQGLLLDRVSMMTWHVLQLWQLIRKEKILVDKAVRTGHPFCMEQFRKVFSTNRVPGLTMDKIACHLIKESEGPGFTFITVLCKGRVFKVEVVDREGEFLTPPELKRQFEAVTKRCEDAPEGQNISVLTAADRTTWAKIREKMSAMDGENAQKLRLIEQSIISVALDGGTLANPGEALRQALSGSAKNRWFDHTTVVFDKNGIFASNNEHSPADAMVGVYSANFIYSHFQRSGPIWKGKVPNRPVPQPEELSFNIDAEIRDAVIETEKTFLKQASDLEAACPSFTDYGKKFIRSYKLHPDAYMQSALQLAYFRLHGKPAATYETATLRQYYHGRTETVRSCTMEVVDWCQAMADNTVPVEEKKELMMMSFKKHIKLMEEAKSMLGCDRHLFGLQVLAMHAGIPMPSIFTDPAYTRSGGGGNFVLSTSLTGYTPVTGLSAPMVHRGYGIFYSIQPERLNYAVSAWKSCKETSADRMSASIQQALRDMRQLLMAL